MKFLKSTFLNDFFEIYLINTKIPKDTKKAVDCVKKLYDTTEEAKENIEKIGKTTDEILNILIENDKSMEKLQYFQDLIQENQRLLALLNLSNNKIDTLIKFLSLLYIKS